MGKILNFLLKAKYKKFYTSLFNQCAKGSFDEKQTSKYDDYFIDDFKTSSNDIFIPEYYHLKKDELGYCPNYGYDSLGNKWIDEQIYWPDPFSIEENGKIHFTKNTKIDWIAKIYYEQKYLNYIPGSFGSYEISINVFDNKIALYACECKTKFLFVYATELKAHATMFNILVAFNIFFSFIKKNNLPLLDIYLERNETYLTYDLLSDPNFRKIFRQNLSFENLFLAKSHEFIALKKHQINSLNVLLIQNTWLISNYWNIFNNSKFEYKDINDTTVIYISPIDYLRKLAKENNFIINQS